MDWVEHDGVSLEALPEWARAPAPGGSFDAAPYRVTIQPEGLVLRRRRRASALRWFDVLALIRVDDDRAPRLLLAAARRPPCQPWFDLSGVDLAAIEQAVRVGLETHAQRGYRASPRVRPALQPEQVLAAVLAHHLLPGGVEIRGPLRRALEGTVWASIGGAGVSGYGGMVATMMFAPVLGPLVGIALGGGIGAAVGAGLAGLHFLRRRRKARVLVLTPDCFVGGLDGGGVRAIAWPSVARFVEGCSDLGKPVLEVYDVDDKLASRTDARYFGETLHVIVAVAEAYRRRATVAFAQ